MKRYLIIILLLFSFGSFAQNTIKISELPAYSANPSGGILPLVVGGSTKKFDAVNFVWTGGAYANPNWITSLAYSKLTGKPTTASGYGIIDVYNKNQINYFFNGNTLISGYNKNKWDSAYSWGSHLGKYAPLKSDGKIDTSFLPKSTVGISASDTASMLNPYARDYNVVHKTLAEVVSGEKTFNDKANFKSGAILSDSLPESSVEALKLVNRGIGNGTKASLNFDIDGRTSASITGGLSLAGTGEIDYNSGQHNFSGDVVLNNGAYVNGVFVAGIMDGNSLRLGTENVSATSTTLGYERYAYNYIGSGDATFYLPDATDVARKQYSLRNTGTGLLTIEGLVNAQIVPQNSNTPVNSFTLQVGESAMLQQIDNKYYIMNIGKYSSGGGSGTVTSISTNNGTGLLGGPITTSGTLSIDTTNTLATLARVNQKLLSKQDFNANTTILGNNTTGTNNIVRSVNASMSGTNILNPTITGGTITSTTLVLPTISSITVSGGVATLPTGTGTLAYAAQFGDYKLKSDTGFVGGYTTRERTRQQTDSVASRINDLANATFIDNINAVPKWAGLSYIESNITDNGTKITLGGTALALSALASTIPKIPIVLPNGDVSTLDTGRAANNLATADIVKRVVDSLGGVKQNYNANTTTLGNSTTGTGAIVRASAPTLTSANLQLPKISSIEAPGVNYISLPSASGTMALTSDLSNYLPLSGGNLTGVVNSTTRLNLGGATDNSSYNLNIIGAAKIATSGTSGIVINGYQPENFINLNNVLSDDNRTFRILAGVTSLGYNGISIYDTYSNATRFEITNEGHTFINRRLNVNGSSDNSFFSLNNNGVAYTKGFAPSLNTYSSNITLSDGHTYVYNGGITANWLLPAAVGNNQAYIVKNEGTGNLNLGTQFGNQIINSDGQALNSLVIAPNECYYLQQNSSNKYYVLFKQGGAGTEVVTVSTAQDITGRKKFVGGFDVGLSGAYTEMNFFSGTNAPDQQYGKIHYGPATGSGTDFKIQAPNGNLSLTTGSGWSTNIGKSSIGIANIFGLNLKFSNITSGSTPTQGQIHNYVGSSGGSITLPSLTNAEDNTFTMWFRCNTSGNFTLNAGANTVIRDLNNNNVSSITVSSGQAAKMIQYDGNGIYYLLN